MRQYVLEIEYTEDWREWFSRQDSWTVDRVLKIQDWLID